MFAICDKRRSLDSLLILPCVSLVRMCKDNLIFLMFCTIIEVQCSGYFGKNILIIQYITHLASSDPSVIILIVGILLWLLFAPIVMTFMCRFLQYQRKNMRGVMHVMYSRSSTLANLMMSHIQLYSRVKKFHLYISNQKKIESLDLACVR